MAKKKATPTTIEQSKTYDINELTKDTLWQFSETSNHLTLRPVPSSAKFESKGIFVVKNEDGTAIANTIFRNTANGK